MVNINERLMNPSGLLSETKPGALSRCSGAGAARSAVRDGVWCTGRRSRLLLEPDRLNLKPAPAPGGRAELKDGESKSNLFPTGGLKRL